MSRIDQALRRATEASQQDATGNRRDAFGAAAVATVELDDYAGETYIAPAEPPAAVAHGTESPAGAEATHMAAPAPIAGGGRLLSDPTTDAACIEECRRLATRLHQMQLERGVKVLLVTSAVPREGKTLMAANLALALSRISPGGVLLVDADLRRPFVHDLFGVANDTGLANWLTSEQDSLLLLDAAPNLSVLPAGRSIADPTAAIASDRMRAGLQDVAARFQWVILDSPPAILGSEAHLLSGLVDGIILVISIGQTDYRLVERAVSELGRERIVGAVLNRVDSAALPSQYYKQYHNRPAAEPARS